MQQKQALSFTMAAGGRGGDRPPLSPSPVPADKSVVDPVQEGEDGWSAFGSPLPSPRALRPPSQFARMGRLLSGAWDPAAEEALREEGLGGGSFDQFVAAAPPTPGAVRDELSEYSTVTHAGGGTGLQAVRRHRHHHQQPNQQQQQQQQQQFEVRADSRAGTPAPPGAARHGAAPSPLRPPAAAGGFPQMYIDGPFGAPTQDWSGARQDPLLWQLAGFSRRAHPHLLRSTPQLNRLPIKPSLSNPSPVKQPKPTTPDYKALVLIGTGIGATPMASVLRSLLYDHADATCDHCGRFNARMCRTRQTKVYVHWVTKSVAGMEVRLKSRLLFLWFVCWAGRFLHFVRRSKFGQTCMQTAPAHQHQCPPATPAAVV
jgi:hypothetical protein